MADLKLRLINEKREVLVSKVPIVWSNDESKALIIEVEASAIDYDWVKDNVLNLLEIILTKETHPALELLIYSESLKADIFTVTIKPKGLTCATNVEVSIPTETISAMKFLVTTLADELGDIILRSSATSALSKTISDMKDALGMSKPTMSAEDNLDELCEKISNETKAEIVKPKETLANYVCNDLLRQELEEIKDFFENRVTYTENNIDLPKGILFKGPWGTGKTYAARCIAGSVDCYFMTCTASALQGMYIGSGAENIRNMFKGAKLLAEKSKKGVIIFIDELDSFGDRANRSGGASGEEDRTLNQLLAEMSGFETDTDIMVLAATNFPERLDSALMRSGRFGRQITIDYPDEYELLQLVTYYFDKVKLKKAFDYDVITSLVKGLTPADIKEIANESGILSIRLKKTEIELSEVNEAINKVITKNIRHPDDVDNLYLITAHECGHVIAEVYYNATMPIKVTNFAYGDVGGFTQSADKMSGILPKERFLNEVRMLLGGRAAEEVMCHQITNGASSDLKKAKEILYNYYKYYNFENYDVSKLDQIVLDKLEELYKEVVDAFKKESVNNILNNVVRELKDKRVLYTSDLFLLTCSIKGGAKLC